MAPCGMADDGGLIVGYNRFANPWTATGFLWTAETGIVDVEDFLADNGVAVPADFDIRSLQGVSADGSTMVGVGQYTTDPFEDWTFVIRVDVNTAVPELGAGATDIARVRARSNPSVGDARLALSLTEGGHAKLSIYDVEGRLVRELLSGSVPAGEHEVYWDGRDRDGGSVPSGVYFYRLEAGGRSEAHKLIMMR